MLSFWRGALGAGLLALAGLAACSDDESGGGGAPDGGAGSAGSAGASGAAGSDAGEAGAPPLAAICVSAPVPKAPAGDDACPAPLPSAPDALDAALTEVGIDRCAYGFTAQTMSIWKPIFADDAWQLPAFAPLHRGLLRLPAYATQTESWLADAMDGQAPLSSAILASSVRRGAAIDDCFDPSAFAEAAATDAPLAHAIALVFEKRGSAAPLDASIEQLSAVPVALQRALVPIVAAIDHAADEFGQALGTTDEAALDFLSHVHGFVIAPQQAFVVNSQSLSWLGAVDHARIARAAAIVARAVEAAELDAFAGATDVPAVAIDTPLGAIVIGSSASDSYDPGHLAERSALFVDVGGDDTYRVPIGAGRRDLPVSVAVDLGGKDLYGYVEVPHALDLPTRLVSDAAGRSNAFGTFGQTLSRTGRQGSGVLGIGLLYDLGSEGDEYRSLTLSQGAAALGVGGLFDAGGDDSYAAEAMSQGAAAFGIGVLIDRDGEDAYRTFTSSQGFGYVGALGTLADGGGNDEYFADPGDPAIGGDPLYPSPQLPGEGNSSFVQGAGFGRRDDAGGNYMGGGFGVLYDRAGTDRYTASVFAQAAGYWLGFGMLIDAGGDDDYRGLWYVQGAAAHFALALQVDRAGNDDYNQSFPVRATSIGVGHDFSGALHLDLGGDDRYAAPGLSLGCGNSQGAGGVVNLGGTDQYQAASTQTLGCASIGHAPPFDDVRDVRPTIGVFVDATGSDTYTLPTGAPSAADEASWSFAVYQSTPGAPASERSGGVDRGAQSVDLP